MHKYLKLLIILIIFVPELYANGPPVSIAIQQFSDFDSLLIPVIKDGIDDFYGDFNLSVTVLPKNRLPATAWYPPRSRYRAEKILIYLDTLRNDSYTKIIGLTSKDISTTKDSIYDWGIFGLGELGGPTCVVSTFRLKKNTISKAIFLRRLLRVINHELGHTFGLDHCPNFGCIMEDAKGTIKTVDNSSGRLCSTCSKWLITNTSIHR
jgi:archaemetzincin